MNGFQCNGCHNTFTDLTYKMDLHRVSAPQTDFFCRACVAPMQRSYHIEALGTGSALSKKFDNSNFIIKIFFGPLKRYYQAFAIDFGITAPKNLYRKLKDTQFIDGVFLTHTHADHAGGIEELAFTNFYVNKKRTPIFTSRAVYDNLWEGLKPSMGHSASQNDFFELGEVSPLHTDMWNTTHVPGLPSIGFSFIFPHDGILRDFDATPEPMLYFSGDTIFDRTQMAYMERAEIILHECSLYNSPVHAGYDQLCTLPENIKKKMLLYHYEDQVASYMKRVKDDGFLGFVSNHTTEPVIVIEQDKIEYLTFGRRVYETL